MKESDLSTRFGSMTGIHRKYRCEAWRAGRQETEQQQQRGIRTQENSWEQKAKSKGVCRQAGKGRHGRKEIKKEKEMQRCKKKENTGRQRESENSPTHLRECP